MPRKLTPKQKLFVEYYTAAGTDSYNNAHRAALRAGYTKTTAKVESCKFLDNPRIKKAISHKQVNIASVLDISRKKQYERINEAYEMAKELKMPSAMTSAAREINEMAGFHRELAPNAEREQARQAMEDVEKVKLAEKMAKERTQELSEGPEVVNIKEIA